MKSKQTIPGFHIEKVAIAGFLLFLVMSAFFSLFLWADDAIKQGMSEMHSDGGMHAPGTGPFKLPFIVDFLAVVLTVVSVVLYLRPARVFFKLKRKGQDIPAALAAKARKLVLRSPVILCLALPVSILVWKVVGLFFSLFVVHDTFMVNSQVDTLFLNAMLAAMAGLFMYLWQKHLVQSRYLPHLFENEQLVSALPSARHLSVKHTLTLVFVLATVLPVVVTLLIVGSGVSIVQSIDQLNSDQLQLLFGDPPDSKDTASGGNHPSNPMMDILNGAGLHKLPLMYFSTVDTWRVLAGLVVGFVLILTYVFAIMRWTAADLIQPIRGLRASMKKMSQGETVPPEPILSANELGELTLGFNTMLKGLEERNRIKGLFGQYLTREVSDAILEGRVNLNGDHYTATIMFTDIRNFTNMSENMAPEEIFAFLNDYLDAMIEVIMANGGFIDKFIGDGILSVFGLPVRSENHANAAVETALQMRVILDELNRKQQSLGRPSIAIGSGIHTGPVIAGNVGNVRRAQFTVIGDTVNLASRLEALNKTYASSILLSDSTWELLTDDLRARGGFERLSSVEIRGKREALTLYKAS